MQQQSKAVVSTLPKQDLAAISRRRHGRRATDDQRVPACTRPFCRSHHILQLNKRSGPVFDRVSNVGIISHPARAVGCAVAEDSQTPSSFPSTTAFSRCLFVTLCRQSTDRTWSLDSRQVVTVRKCQPWPRLRFRAPCSFVATTPNSQIPSSHAPYRSLTHEQ